MRRRPPGWLLCVAVALAELPTWQRPLCDIGDKQRHATAGAKLYFRHGAVSSAKTLSLLACAHNYEAQGKKVVVIKPELDVRFGKQKVASRAGLDRDADILVTATTTLVDEHFDGCACVLVDEAQFVSAHVVEQLRDLATRCGVPVICYGLRTDFRTELFEGSRRLLELADSIEEVKTTCAYCNRKAVFNLKSVDGVATLDGPKVALGSEELYLPTCAYCYRQRLGVGWGNVRRGADERGAGEGGDGDADHDGVTVGE